MTPLAIGTGLGLAGMAGYLAPQGLRISSVSSLSRAVRQQRALCLTYDDGPGRVTTPMILDRLAAAGGRATFFTLGQGVAEHPEMVRRIVADGHDLGAHSARHLHGWRVGPIRHARDNDAGFEALAGWIDDERPLFRPTYGKLTLASWLVARRRGAAVAWWTHDSGDTWDELPPIERTIDAVAAEGGGVVLLHDLDRSAPRRAFVVEMTERLLATARSHGLAVIGLRELLAAGVGE